MSLVLFARLIPRWIWIALAIVAMGASIEYHGRSVVRAEWAVADEARNELVRETRKGLDQVVTKTEVVETIRLQNIYVKGKEIEKQVPIFVDAADDQRFGVNVGFVRMYNAAWSGSATGPAEESDRGSAGIPLSDLAGTEAHNATSCLAWREIALGLRQYYADLKLAIPQQ